MADKQNNASQTNAQQVRKQNQAAAQGGRGAEFASETDAQEVRKQNQQAEQQKQQKQQ